MTSDESTNNILAESHQKFALDYFDVPTSSRNLGSYLSEQRREKMWNKFFSRKLGIRV